MQLAEPAHYKSTVFSDPIPPTVITEFISAIQLHRERATLWLDTGHKVRYDVQAWLSRIMAVEKFFLITKQFNGHNPLEPGHYRHYHIV